MPVSMWCKVGRAFQQVELRGRWSRMVWPGSHGHEASRGGGYAVLAEPERIRRDSGRISLASLVTSFYTVTWPHPLEIC